MTPAMRDARAETLPPEGRALVKAAAAGRGEPVYLLYGEPLLVRAVAAALVDTLVPPERRSFNLEIYDGRTTPLRAVLDSARMPGLMSGAKMIWVRELPLLAAADRRADSAQVFTKAVKEGRLEAAGARFMATLASAGWSQEDFETRTISQMPKSRIAEAFGEVADAETMAALDELQCWARERNMDIAAAADAGTELLDMIEEGFPPGVVLLLTAASVDGRKRIVKRLREVAEVVELTVKRERSGALSTASAAAVIGQVLAAHGKRLETAARDRLLRLAGSDSGALANEVEKLCLFVGDAAAIKAGDVDAVVRDSSNAWIFDLTDALAESDARRALAVLRRLLEGGDHPLRLLATLHSHFRLLLMLRECLDGPWKGEWRPGTSPGGFSRLLSFLGEDERAVLGRIHPYRLSLNAGPAARMDARRLRGALWKLAELDGKFKSSRGDPGILLEALILDFCR